MARMTSAPIPAGTSKPIRIPPGTKKVIIGNQDHGNGWVFFTLGSMTYYKPYNSSDDPETIADIIYFPDTQNNPLEASDDNYHCFFNDADDGQTVIVHIEDLIIPMSSQVEDLK